MTPCSAAIAAVPLSGKRLLRSISARTAPEPSFSAKDRKRTAQYTVPTGWYVDENGKRHRKYKTKGGFEKKTDALAFIESLKKEGERKPAPTLAEYWQQYSTGALLKLGKDKITAYKIAWKRMASLAHRRIDTLSVKEMQECVNSQTSTFYPAKDMRQLFKALFKIAAAEKYVDKDLPEFIELPELEETEQNPFTVEEQKALWKSYESGNRDAAIPLCMIYTGMMTGEMMKLEGSMIHWDDNQIVGVSLKTKVRKIPCVFPGRYQASAHGPDRRKVRQNIHQTQNPDI